MKITHFRHVARASLRLAMAAAALLCTVAAAQSRSDVRQPSEPLVLKAQGSFFVGGRQMFSDAAGWNLIGLLGQFSSGDVTVDQMYVRQCPRRALRTKLCPIEPSPPTRSPSARCTCNSRSLRTAVDACPSYSYMVAA